MNKQEMNAADIARAAKHASFALAAAPSNVRDNALLSVAAALARESRTHFCREREGHGSRREGRAFRACAQAAPLWMSIS